MTPKTRSQTFPSYHSPDRTSEDKLHDSIDLNILPRPQSAATSDSKSVTISEDPFYDTHAPPVYTIDLSLPPAQRYVQVAMDFLSAIRCLPVLFDELIKAVPVAPEAIHFLTRLTLRRLHSHEHTEEIRGIHKATGVPMYLLVAFNVLLDVLMGCTSGAVRAKESAKDRPKMLHFRTLDWGMPALKRVIVQFEFRESKDGPVIARAINYVGYVGMLTAVRRGLSVSLNFRPYHNDDISHLTNIKFGIHLLSVVLGFRPSISAHLRDFILPGNVHKQKRRRTPPRSPQSIADIARCFPSVPTTAAYLLFCDGKRALVLEKDRVTAKPLVSSSFILATIHDVSYEANNATQAQHVIHAKQSLVGMEDLVAESIDRKKCMTSKWERRCKRLGSALKPHPEPYVRLAELKTWMQDCDIMTPGVTHFGTIMDPSEGNIIWTQIAEDESLEDQADMAHQL